MTHDPLGIATPSMTVSHTVSREVPGAGGYFRKVSFITWKLANKGPLYNSAGERRLSCEAAPNQSEVVSWIIVQIISQETSNGLGVPIMPIVNI